MTDKFKKVNGIWFSPTGTTEKIVSIVAQSIKNSLGNDCELVKVNFTLPEERVKPIEYESDDVIILGVPVYAGRVSNILLKYLETIKGNGALAVPIVLYGNRNYDDALVELTDIIIGNGFKVIGAGAFIGEHSFSKILAKRRPDRDDIKVANGFGLEVSNKIKSGDIEGEVKVNGNRPYRSYYRPRDVNGKVYDFRKIKPKTNEKCNNCKVCVDLCPMGSVDSEDVSKFNGICIKCGACIKGCPTEARYYDDVNYLKHQHELEDEFETRKEPEIFL
jgi:NAD-dependent dihydropyrimidine dehydrogenase PreA subunit/flavodoxin